MTDDIDRADVVADVVARIDWPGALFYLDPPYGTGAAGVALDRLVRIRG